MAITRSKSYPRNMESLVLRFPRTIITISKIVTGDSKFYYLTKNVVRLDDTEAF